MDEVNASQLADLAGISAQKARAALALGAAGKLWRGVILETRLIHGRGGLGGKARTATVRSLPVDLKARYKRLETPIQLSLKLDGKAEADAGWWFALLAPALRADKGSTERAEAIKAIVAAEHIRNGARVRVSDSTVRRMIKRFDQRGHAGLRRKEREGADEKIVIISRKWDAATNRLSNDMRKRIAADLARYRRSLWGNGAKYIDVKRLASEFLADATLDAGIVVPEAELQAMCDLPKHVVEVDRDARDVHEFKTNIKAWDDKRPRMLLTSAGLRRMEIVYADVHHFDVYLRREDDSLATPKGIAWLDAATGEIRIDIVLCEPGTAIRNADLIASFLRMATDPYWSLPETVYLDNGSEYNWAEFVKDALSLNNIRIFTFGEGKSNPVRRAKAYNAAAKGILEGSFRILEEILSSFPGYIGGNRMNSRRAQLGQAPKHYPGTFAMFNERVQELIDYWMTRPRGGDLGGKSPRQVLADLIEGGWERMDVDPHALAVAFSIKEERKVTDGKISAPGGKYYCDELPAYTGQKVIVRIPKFDNWPGIPVYTLKGEEFIGVARLEVPTRRDDPRGAVEAARRTKVARRAIKAKEATFDALDVPALMAASGKRHKRPPEPKSAGRITLSPADALAGRHLAETPHQQHNREHQEKQARLAERLALAKTVKPKDQP